jgi:hypothetical protein
MKVNAANIEECVYDNGSQIVSMSKNVATRLGIVWNPGIRVSMESATNHYETTLGLARNVKFEVGELEIFLQVHIFEKPPYEILLGRPFEALTSCVTKAELDGSSELILTCPNTKRQATVPTYDRGTGPGQTKKQCYQGF